MIGEVFIDAQNIFDLADPQENLALYRAANTLHISTRPRVIRQQLLFKSGDPYSERVLAESERILRSMRYLYDASIRPIAYKDGRVDVAVTTRDVWTLNPGVSFSRQGGKNTAGVELEELNILGSGAAVELAQHSGVDRDSASIEYRNPHVGGTRARLSGRYASNSDGATRGLDIDRPFYALDTRWSASLSLLDDERTSPLYDLGKVVSDFDAQQKFASVAGGWSSGLQHGWVRRWIVGATHDEKSFAATARTVDGLVPEDRKFIYPWFGFELIEDEFQKTRNRDQIGRTEDFLLGARVSAHVGWADTALGSDRDALLFALKASRGRALSERTTLLLNGGLEARLEKADLHNALLSASARYYTKISEKRLFFSTLEASAGRALDLDTQVLLGGDSGLRGYPLRYQGGEARALWTVEERFFTNWYPFRLFRIGGAAFFDIGRTWGSSPVSTPSQGWLKDIGIGLRIGNSRSGLGNIIHVDLAFPLDGDPSIKNMQLLIETRERF